MGGRGKGVEKYQENYLCLRKSKITLLVIITYNYAGRGKSGWKVIYVVCATLLIKLF